MIAHQTSEPSGDCYVALELSRSKWLIGAILPGQEKLKTTTVAGGDTAALLQALDDIRGRARALGPSNPRLRACFEAGYDGFWLARFLADRGIDVTVLDATSFLVSRRGRRVQTDRIDVEAMAFTLKAFCLGDKSVCRAVRVPTPEEADAKRVSRERSQLVKERTRNINRIRGLLNLHGIGRVLGLHGGDWRSWLDEVRTGDGRRLEPFLVRELYRHYERLHLVIEQIRILDSEGKAVAAQRDRVPWVTRSQCSNACVASEKVARQPWWLKSSAANSITVDI
ncbi:IS110 family transposase [Roseobacter weihaiensis]|uniref:IS110 family transposase n=1 Tax=Roseobacter weihaiensis TaxID=2763262 RepID=UPI001D09FB08|nr:transposase [Roseobacter sp. H9]